MKKKLTSLTTIVIKAPFPTRDALNLAKFSASLLKSSVRDAALELLVASIAAIEAASVPDKGTQVRSKRKALRVAYRHGSRAVAGCVQVATPILFATADRYAKRSREAAASLGLLSPSFNQLAASDREQFLVLLATICVKAPALSKDLFHICGNLSELLEVNLLALKVVPILNRALLREPQTALASSTTFLTIISQKDMSESASKSFVPAIIQAVKSSDEKTRQNGVALARALSPCLLKEESVAAAYEAQFSVLKGARYAYQKVATMSAISAVTCLSPTSHSSIKKATEEILNWLSSKKESNEEVRFASLRSLVQLSSTACKRQQGDSLAEPFQNCASYFADVLRGKTSESDLRFLLISLTENVPQHQLTLSFLEDSVISSLEALVVRPSIKKKQDDLLRAMAALVAFDEQRSGELRLTG